MQLFKQSISEKLNLDLIKFADREKSKKAKEQLYLKKDVQRDLNNSVVIGLASGSAMTLVAGSMLAYVTNTIPLDLMHSNVQMAIIPASIALAVTPIMSLYDKLKEGSCKFSGKKIVDNAEYEFDYQKLSIFKERIASKIKNPLKDKESPYMTASQIKKSGRDNLYHSFAAGVTSTILLSSLSGLASGHMATTTFDAVMNTYPYALSFFAVSPVLNLIDKFKENYNKINISLKQSSELSKEIDYGMENNMLVAPIMETRKLDINIPTLSKLDLELPAKKPAISMNYEGLMSVEDFKTLSNDIKAKYAELLPPAPVNVNSPEYFTAMESEIDSLIKNSKVHVNIPEAHEIVIPMTKDDLKKPLFLDVATNKIEDSVKVNEPNAVQSVNQDLTTSDLLKFVTKINETYEPLPTPKNRQIPKEVFIFEEPELIDMPVSGISAKSDVSTELNINIPKELEGMKASKNGDILPILSIDDRSFKVKEGDSIKLFFKNYIDKKQGVINKEESIVANKQDRAPKRLTM